MLLMQLNPYVTFTTLVSTFQGQGTQNLSSAQKHTTGRAGDWQELCPSDARHRARCNTILPAGMGILILI